MYSVYYIEENLLMPIYLQPDMNKPFFEISNLDDLIYQSSNLDISKVYDIGLQRYKYLKIRVCGKNSNCGKVSRSSKIRHSQCVHSLISPMTFSIQSMDK